MTRRALYIALDPESLDVSALAFRGIHHIMVAAGTAIMLLGSVAAIRDRYGMPLTALFAVTAAFFAAEYVLRLIAAPEAPGHGHSGVWRARLGWVVSLGGMFDLAGALPAMFVPTEGLSASLLAFIWSFKYVRYSPGLASLRRVVANAQEALLSVLLGFLIVLLSAASIAYLLERGANPDAFDSIPSALWWAIVTMTTTGYGDIVPQTVTGRVLAGVVMVGGILVFALWAGILANGYAYELRRREFLRTWELVAKVPFFRNIGASLIAEVARLLRPRDYPAGAVIMRRGEPGDRMYFLVDGEVEVQLPTQSLYLGPGQFFGELALLTGEPRNATVVAAQSCTLLALDIVDFHELLGHQPELARVIQDEARRRLDPRPAAAEPALAERVVKTAAASEAT